MILVDSSVWIDFFNGINRPHVDKLYEILGNEVIVTGDLIVVEVLQGFHKDSHFETANFILEGLQCFPLCNKSLAIAAAKNYRFLRKCGVTVKKTIDMIIGTFCIENKITLLHNDKDFISMETHLNLKVLKY